MNVSAENSDWQGTVAFAPMLALFVGNGGGTPRHQTVAHKIILGAKQLLVGSTHNVLGEPVVVPAGIEHQFDARGRKVVVAYLDARHYTFKDADDLAYRWRAVDPQVVSIDCLQEDAETMNPRAIDARILKAMIALEEYPTIRMAAASLGMSDSRFTHIITEQLGAPPQRWRRWLRLRRAIDLLADGQNITASAHEAGFSDSAHFSRTCVEALGVRPSVLKSVETKFVRSSEACDLALA